MKIPNLASHTLSLALQQLREDWYQTHTYRPVLVETFVDDTQYKGTCYHAANWQCIGGTSGKDWKDKENQNNNNASRWRKVLVTTSLYSEIQALRSENDPGDIFWAIFIPTH